MRALGDQILFQEQGEARLCSDNLTRKIKHRNIPRLSERNS